MACMCGSFIVHSWPGSVVCPYLFSSAARALSSSLLAGSPSPSARTGPCMKYEHLIIAWPGDMVAYGSGLVVAGSSLALSPAGRGAGVALVQRVRGRSAVRRLLCDLVGDVCE